MISKLIVALLFGLSTILYCQNTHLNDELKEISKLLENQARAWNKGSIAGYMEGYWKSDSLLFTSSGNIQRGWYATYEKYKKTYDSKKKMGELKFTELEIILLSEQSAWIFGNWELKREKDNPRGVFTLVLRKFKDGWRIIHDHTSSVK